MKYISLLNSFRLYHSKLSLGLLLFFSLVLFTMSSCQNSEDWKSGKIIPMQEYSLEDPREWEEIAPEHIPQARISWDKGKVTILIETPHLIATYNHYIEKYGVLDLEGKELGSTLIDRTNAPLNYGYILFELVKDHKKVKVYAKCNLHDLWVHTLTIEKLLESSN